MSVRTSLSLSLLHTHAYRARVIPRHSASFGGCRLTSRMVFALSTFPPANKRYKSNVRLNAGKEGTRVNSESVRSYVRSVFLPPKHHPPWLNISLPRSTTRARSTGQGCTLHRDAELIDPSKLPETTATTTKTPPPLPLTTTTVTRPRNHRILRDRFSSPSLRDCERGGHREIFVAPE